MNPENKPMSHKDWTPCERYALSLVGQQQALTLDQLASFLSFSEEPPSEENLTSTSHAIVERLRQAGLVSVHQFDPRHCWIWLTEKGRRSLEIPAERTAPIRAILPTLHAINAIRLSLREQYPHGIWTNQEHVHLKRSQHMFSPVATIDTGEGAPIAIFLLLRWTGSEEQMLTSIRHHLRDTSSSGGKSFSALWYYASPQAALHLRHAFAQIAQEDEGEAHRLHLFGYPLIPKVHVYHGHHSPIGHLAWSPKGEWIATTDEAEMLHVWSAQTGAVLFTTMLSDVPTTALAWSPDGTRIALTNEDGVLCIYDAATGEPRSVIHLHTDIITGLAWAPGQKHDRLATCAIDGSIQVFDLTHMHPVWKAAYGYEHGWSALAWSPDGTQLAAGSNDTRVRLFDAATGHLLFTYKNHPHLISALAWSPDSALVASASDDLDVHIWRAQSGKTIRRFWSTLGMIYRLDWSCDGTRLAWIGDTERVEVWDPQTGKRLVAYDDHATIVNAIAWSPDGRLLASGGADHAVHVSRMVEESQ